MKLVLVTDSAAKTMIVAFGINQSEITKATNRRGTVPKRLLGDERRFVSQLLHAITGHKPTQEDISDVIDRL